MKVKIYYAGILIFLHQFSNTELESLAPYCMHIKAVKIILEAFDTEHNLTPNDFLNGNITIAI